jgi:uncharacterized protein YjlB
VSTGLYVGQLPANPLRINVTGADLDDYDTVAGHLTDPLGVAVDLDAGDVVLDEAGVVQYVWGPASPFTMVGDYTVQLRLTTASATDYTTTDTIEVTRAEVAP